MTREPDVIGLLEDYLDEYEGATPLPDATRDAVRARIPSTSQRPAWWPGWRFPDMNTMTRYALGAAAAVLVAIVGFTVLNGGGGNIGSADPTDTPDPIPSHAPSESPAAALPALGDGLTAGSYYIDVSPHGYDPNGDIVEGIADYRVSFDLPGGWDGLGWAATKQASRSTSLSLETPHNLFDVPCESNAGSSRLKDHPDMHDPAGFTAKLAELWQGGGNSLASEPTEATIAGHAASYVEVVTPDDISFGECYDNKFQVWTGRWLQEPGQMQRIWVIETDDGLLLFESSLEPGATAAEIAEADTIMASMTIAKLEAPAP